MCVRRFRPSPIPKAACVALLCRLAFWRCMSASSATVDIGSLIARTPGIKGGTPHIVGTGVTVRTIVRWYKVGLSPEEIAGEIPHLSLAQVYTALAYYHANRDEMEAEMSSEEASSDKIEQEYLRKKNRAA